MQNTLASDIFIIYFSPFSAHAVAYNGTIYPTVEHAYHCQRYADPVIIAEIHTARSPAQAWEISQRYKSQQVSSFEVQKRVIMKKLCRAKLQQHEDVWKALIDSGNAQIIKHRVVGPPADGFWDNGTDGKGRNEVGKIWMELREELM